MTLHGFINSDVIDKRNIVQLYNHFFTISINFSKNFHQNIVIYFEAILDIIKHKIFEKNTHDLKYNYYTIIETLIEKTFVIVNSRKDRRGNSNG